MRRIILRRASNAPSAIGSDSLTFVVEVLAFGKDMLAEPACLEDLAHSITLGTERRGLIHHVELSARLHCIHKFRHKLKLIGTATLGAHIGSAHWEPTLGAHIGCPHGVSYREPSLGAHFGIPHREPSSGAHIGSPHREPTSGALIGSPHQGSAWVRGRSPRTQKCLPLYELVSTVADTAFWEEGCDGERRRKT